MDSHDGGDVECRIWMEQIRMKPLDHFLQVDRMFFIAIYMFLKFEPESGKKLTNS